MAELIMAIVTLVLPSTGPCEALAALDVIRAQAWASGDERLLDAVYAPSVERQESAALRQWTARAVSVDGARVIRARCQATSATSVLVVERLAAATAVLPDGSRRRLPAGSWTRRVIDVERLDAWWRVVRVG